MAIAAYQKKVNVSTDGATWHALAMTNPSFDNPTELEDTTNMRDGVGYRDKLPCLQDWSVGGDVIYEDSDTALDMVKNSKLNRTDLYVQYLPLGTVASGWQGKVVVESFSLAGDVSGVEMVSISMQGNGALVQAT